MTPENLNDETVVLANAIELVIAAVKKSAVDEVLPATDDAGLASYTSNAFSVINKHYLNEVY